MAFNQQDLKFHGYQGNSQRNIGPFAGKGPKGYRRSDESIMEEVCEALKDDPFVDPLEVEVTVEDGIVTLWGTVSTREMKRLAEDIALDTHGVEDVVNKLFIGTRFQHESVMADRSLRLSKPKRK